MLRERQPETSTNEIAGKTDDALRVLNELVGKYPETPLIDEIQFRRGEMLFLRKNYFDSEVAYQSVIYFGEQSRFYEQSLYKLGWSQFKLAKHEQSLTPFFDLLDIKVAGIDLKEVKDRLEGCRRVGPPYSTGDGLTNTAQDSSGGFVAYLLTLDTGLQCGHATPYVHPDGGGDNTLG